MVWNMNFIVPYIGNFIIPTDDSSYFSDGVGQSLTSKWLQLYLNLGCHGNTPIYIYIWVNYNDITVLPHWNHG